MQVLRHDPRHALHQLRRSPGFALTAIGARRLGADGEIAICSGRHPSALARSSGHYVSGAPNLTPRRHIRMKSSAHKRSQAKDNG